MKPWHVLHVKPRCEKKMESYCRHARQCCFLPLRRETKIYQRRKVTVEKPVFPSYVFSAFDADGRAMALRSNYVVHVFTPLRQRRFIHELLQVKRALAIDPTLGIALEVRTGTPVRITGGPFRGIEGIVTTLKGISKVLLNVDMVGQSVVVEVDRSNLELLS